MASDRGLLNLQKEMLGIYPLIDCWLADEVNKAYILMPLHIFLAGTSPLMHEAS